MTTLGLGLGSALAPLGSPVTANVTFLSLKYASGEDAINIPELLEVGVPVGLADIAHMSGTPAVVRGVAALLADAVDLTTTLETRYGLQVVERLVVTRVLAANSYGGATALDAMALTDVLTRGIPDTLADSIETTDVLGVVAAVAVIEALGLTETVLGAAVRALTVAEMVSLAEALGNFFGGDITDTINISETLASVAAFASTTTEAIAVTPETSARMLLRVVTTEALEISDTEALQLLFSPVLEDVLELTAGYVSPNGVFTSWAMNTRTAAVTEYNNFEFNSFGVLAGRSVGATSDGLYELTGDDDNGDAIIARIKSGFMQFGGTKLSRLKSAYIATRGDAEFVLRIETGQGELYNYAVSTRDMRSTKVHMGKGQRARYFSFELIGAGEDFDIDTLEFVPIVMARRV